MTRHIGYNSQRNNVKVNGLGGYSQCFSTVNWMRMSYYSPLVIVEDDKGLAQYLQYIETEGKKLENVPHPSLYFDVQAAGVTKWLNDRGVSGHDVFQEKFPIDALPEKLKKCPITIGTHNLGGLPNGHIILLVDWDEYSGSFVVNDPFGDAILKYDENNSGESLLYPFNFLLPYINYNGGTAHVLYWEDGE
jgi:hypothetical protein